MRFDGYNRHDFHYPRNTREAFGSGFTIDKPANKFVVFLKWVAIYAVLIAVMFLTQGMK